MFETINVIFIILLSILGYFGIKQDISSRKISNKINILTFVLAISTLVYNFQTLQRIDFIVIFIIIFISYLLFHKKIWGAGDGKLFISLGIILISFGGFNFFLNFIVNLSILYSIVIILLALYLSNKKDIISTFKRLKHYELLFVLVLIFTIMQISFIFIDLSVYSDSIFLMILAGIFIFLMFFYRFLKKIFYLINEDFRFLVIFFSILALIYYSSSLALIFFGIVFIIKTFIDFSSRLVERIKLKYEEEYNSPFGVYLYLICILTILLQTNIISIILRFFI